MATTPASAHHSTTVTASWSLIARHHHAAPDSGHHLAHPAHSMQARCSEPRASALS